MKRELFLQIAEIENRNDVSNVINNIVNAFQNHEITHDQFNHLMYDLDLELKSLDILK